MKATVEIFMVSKRTNVARKHERTFEVEGRTSDDLRAAARARLEKAGAKIRSISNGARSVIVYVEVDR